MDFLNKLPQIGNLLISLYRKNSKMKVFFEDKALEEYVRDGKSKVKPYKEYAKDKLFTKRLQEVVAVMLAVDKVSDLALYSFLKYEALKYGYSGLSSVRIMNNRVERLIFKELEYGLEITIIELDKTHYGNK